MFGAYVKENRKALIALTVYTAVFALIFWLYRLPLGAVGYAALVCPFLLLVWLAVDYRRFAVRLRLLRRLEQEITLSTEQLPEPDGALEVQYQALVRALDADRRAQMTRSHVNMSDGEIARKIDELFDLRPKAIEDRLKLRNPIYQETAAYGHMGREPQVVTKHFKSRYEGDKDVTVELFTWEKLDYVDKVKAAFGL